MNSGLRSFEDVSRVENYLGVYETEVYDIDYKNFTFSSGFHLKLGWNWVQKKNYSIRQSGSIAFEVYKEQIDFVLTDIGNGDSVSWGYWGESDVKIGYQETAVAANFGIAVTQELIYLRNKENFSWGGGVSFTSRTRSDIPFNQSPSQGVYIPNSRSLAWGRYYTQQIGLVFHIEKVMNRGMIYLNLNQQVFTAKRDKGAKWFLEDNELNPVSHNMDFRFPLIIQFGGSLQFGKNKK